MVLPSVLSTRTVLRCSEPHDDDGVAMRGFQGDDIDSSCAGVLVVSVAWVPGSILLPDTNRRWRAAGLHEFVRCPLNSESERYPALRS